MAFHQFLDDEGEPFGSFEVFFEHGNPPLFEGDHGNARGWYWWACSPGCLPDSDEVWGPFATEAEAIADANS